MCEVCGVVVACGGRHSCSAAGTSLNTSEQLVPPNPNELDITARSGLEASNATPSGPNTFSAGHWLRSMDVRLAVPGTVFCRDDNSETTPHQSEPVRGSIKTTKHTHVHKRIQRHKRLNGASCTQQVPEGAFG